MEGASPRGSAERLIRGAARSGGAHRYRGIWLAVAPVGLWAVVRLSGLDGDTFLAPLLAFTPYAALAAFLLAGVCVALRNWAAAMVTATALLALAAAVLPRAFGGGEPAPPGATRLKVLSANVYHGKAYPVALVALVDRLQPDLLSIQELNPSLLAQLRRLGIGRRLPESIVFTQRGVTGAGLLSRYPLSPLPGFGRLGPRLLHGELTLPGGERLRLVDVHPFTPAGSRAAEWAGELTSLPSAGRGTPWLLVGDFNATLDHAELRHVIERGYRDAGDVTGNGLIPTWPNDRAYPPLITIDHVLADRRLGISGYGVEDVPGTDHRAIWAELFRPTS